MSFAFSAALPGFALAPVGIAHASVEEFLDVPPPATAISIPIDPVFASSAEEDAEAKPNVARAEVEAYRFGAREVPRRIVETIVGAARAADVDAVYLMALADKESSFRPDIRAATSSAEGLFQFVDRTWLTLVQAHGAKYGLDMEADAITTVDGRPIVEDSAMQAQILDLRREPYLAAVMAAELLKQDASEIGLRIGRKLNATELYLAHFLGLEGAARFLALRDARRPPSAARAFPAAARANAAIFFDAHRRRRRGLTVPEVYARIGGMMDRRLARFRDVETLASAEAR